MMVSKSPRIGASRGETRQQPDHGSISMGAAMHVSRMGPCGPICELKKAVNHGVGWEGCHPLVVY